MFHQFYSGLGDNYIGHVLSGLFRLPNPKQQPDTQSSPPQDTPHPTTTTTPMHYSLSPCSHVQAMRPVRWWCAELASPPPSAVALPTPPRQLSTRLPTVAASLPHWPNHPQPPSANNHAAAESGSIVPEPKLPPATDVAPMLRRCCTDVAPMLAVSVTRNNSLLSESMSVPLTHSVTWTRLSLCHHGTSVIESAQPPHAVDALAATKELFNFFVGTKVFAEDR